MDLNQLILDRRTVHDFKTEKVDWTTVREALELSLWSLNHRLSFPWVYFRAGEQARKTAAEVMVSLGAKKSGPLSGAMADSIRAKILNPSEVIFLGQKKSEDPMRAKEDYATLACSVQIASLYLWSKGIGSKWSTGAFINHSETKKALGINEEQVELVGCYFVGIPLRIPKAAQRPPIDEVIVEAP